MDAPEELTCNPLRRGSLQRCHCIMPLITKLIQAKLTKQKLSKQRDYSRVTFSQELEEPFPQH